MLLVKCPNPTLRPRLLFRRPSTVARPQLHARCCQAADQGAQGSGQPAASRRALLPSLAAAAALLAAGPSLAEPSREGEVRHTEAEWRKLLTPEQFAVLRQAGTEPRFASPLVQEKRTGTFRCGGCGAALFSSAAKYESGTGWPSFTAALPGAVETQPDLSLPFVPRTEVHCTKCKGHLGHVFDDGPEPTGLRYCMNGVALTFEPAAA